MILTDSVWYRFRRPGQRLRIGVLADAEGVEAWLAGALSSLGQLPELSFADLFLLPARRSPVAAPPWLFRRLEAWSRAGGDDCFRLAGGLPAAAERYELQGDGAAGLEPRDRALIAARQLDVLLCATRAPVGGDCAGLARLGVWSIFPGEPEFAAARPPFWREVYEGRSVSRISLLVHDRCFERGRMLDSFVTSTDVSLRFTRNRTVPLDAAGALLGRVLLASAERQTAPPGGEEVELATARPQWPTTAQTMAFVSGKLARSVRLRARARGTGLTWLVGIRQSQGEPYREIAAPPGHYFADPFLVERDSRHWLFVEDWVEANGRGRLACMEISEGGRAGQPEVILDKPYHLSYPHVFEHRGDYFMIPESCAGSTVELYRATGFPFEWKLEALLAEGVDLVDTTALLQDGVWYFFTSYAYEPQEAYLFTAARLDGPWQYHPANPIGTDTRNLRSAGAFVSRAGGLIRPAQDCSLGYGYAVAFNEIRRLSPAEFESRETGRLLPTWAPGLTGTHTYNCDSKYEVVDGRKLVPRMK